MNSPHPTLPTTISQRRQRHQETPHQSYSSPYPTTTTTTTTTMMICHQPPCCHVTIPVQRRHLAIGRPHPPTSPIHPTPPTNHPYLAAHAPINHPTNQPHQRPIWSTTTTMMTPSIYQPPTTPTNHHCHPTTNNRTNDRTTNLPTPMSPVHPTHHPTHHPVTHQMPPNLTHARDRRHAIHRRHLPTTCPQ